jgi:hypothetical protein
MSAYKFIDRRMVEFHVYLYGERGEAVPVERVLLPVDGGADSLIISKEIEQHYRSSAHLIYPELGEIVEVGVGIVEFPYPVKDVVKDESWGA